jgi:hypothetical protein
MKRPYCPKCSKEMIRAVVEAKWSGQTSYKDRHASVWLCEPKMGGCGEQVPYVPPRR